MGKRMRVAFLGLGAMGGRMASCLVNDDIELKVWSRSGVPSWAPSLGAFSARTPADAARDADTVFAMVTDDEASRSVWLDDDVGALRGMRSGAVIVECSTLSPGWVSTLAGRAKDAGLEFIDAPVVGSRPHAERGNLTFLAGGDAAVLEPLRPILGRMGGAVKHVGASPAGAYAKLIVNTLFGVQVAALAEVLGFAARARLDTAALMQALEGLPVLSPAASGAATGVLARRFEPMFPVALAAKDLRYALEAAERVGGDLPVSRGASEVFERGLAGGLRDENLTAVAKLYDEE
ncbi:NAD(P)-dependent oxidoreductase [Sorangium sp. So ce367]|uniref:NAD(P)-dependent oxidoreductase n=1 Tax=Sorangium sp. So ce367 TaxID=3133305 RepID=UPI003F5D96CB